MTDFKFFGYMSTYSFSYSKTFQLYLKRDNSSSLHWSWDIRYWNSLSPHCYYIQIRGITKKVREIERDKKQWQQCGERRWWRKFSTCEILQQSLQTCNPNVQRERVFYVIHTVIQYLYNDLRYIYSKCKSSSFYSEEK